MDATCIGIDPGVSGAVSIIRPFGLPEIHKCPDSLQGMTELLSKAVVLSVPEQIRITLEKVGSFGMEGRATLATFMINFGQWQGIIETNAIIDRVQWQLVTPQAWQKPYRERLIAGPPKPKDAIKATMSRAEFAMEIKLWKSANEKAKRARKKELMRIAEENGAPLKPLNLATADSYLIALHGRNEIEWT